MEWVPKQEFTWRWSWSRRSCANHRRARLYRFAAVAGTLAAMLLTTNLFGTETRYETVGGTTYRVTRRLEKRPVAATRVEAQTQTVYATEYVTEMREKVQTAWVPVTEYVTVPRWHQWWNPFAEPYMAYETRPITRWELRTQMVRQPVTLKKQVPQEQIVRKPVRELGFVEEPIEERVVVNTLPNNGSRPAPDVRYAERPGQLQADANALRRGQPVTNLAPPVRR